MCVWWFQSLASCAVGLELPFAKGEVKARSVQVPSGWWCNACPRSAPVGAGLGLYHSTLEWPPGT